MLRMSAPQPIQLQVQAVPLTVRQTTALALILQELVSNSLKHGDGEIEITFATEGNTAMLEVCNSGSGYPQGFAPRNGSTGMELLDTSVRWDLEGKIRFDNREEGGARARVSFSLGQPGAAVPTPDAC